MKHLKSQLEYFNSLPCLLKIIDFICIVINSNINIPYANCSAHFGVT